MEGFGIGAALYRHDPSIPFIVVKGICDRADSTKNDDWHQYAAAAAASYTLHLLTDEFNKADKPLPIVAADEATVPGHSITRRAFRFLVASSYDLGELKILCFDIDVDWDDLSGDTKSLKVVSLYLYCERKNKLTQLIAAVDRDTNGGITKFANP